MVAPWTVVGGRHNNEPDEARDCLADPGEVERRPPSSRQRELDRLAHQLYTDGEIYIINGPSLKAGSRLVRHWNGKVYCVTALDEGFEFEERYYSSLTKIAREITGAAWSGPRFF